MSRLEEISSTGDVEGTGSWQLFSVTLTAGSDAASVIVKEDGTSGTARLTLKAAAGATASWRSGDPNGIQIARPHVTLSGTGPVVDVEYG